MKITFYHRPGFQTFFSKTWRIGTDKLSRRWKIEKRGRTHYNFVSIFPSMLNPASEILISSLVSCVAKTQLFFKVMGIIQRLSRSNFFFAKSRKGVQSIFQPVSYSFLPGSEVQAEALINKQSEEKIIDITLRISFVEYQIHLT